jgi:hypothetical protein
MVERVCHLFPQLQATEISRYSGCTSAFMAIS